MKKSDKPNKTENSKPSDNVKNLVSQMARVAKVKLKRLKAPLEVTTIKPKEPRFAKQNRLLDQVKKRVEEATKGDFSDNRSITKMLLDAGYSSSQAHASAEIIKSKSFREELMICLDANVLRVLRTQHFKGLSATKLITISVDEKTPEETLIEIGKKFEGTYIAKGGNWFGNRQVYYAVPDHLSRAKYYDQLFRILGEYSQDSTNPKEVDPLRNIPNPQLTYMVKTILEGEKQ